MKPRHTNPIADFKVVYGRAFLDDSAGDFVPQNYWLFHDACQLGPVAISDVQIGVAHSAGFDLNKHVAIVKLRTLHIFHRQRLLEIM
jgi:hypothetical protein